MWLKRLPRILGTIALIFLIIGFMYFVFNG